MKTTSLLAIVLFSFTIGCTNPSYKIKETAEAYYEVYKTRNDFDEFLSFYADEILLEDYINGDRIEGKQALREFLDWGNPNYHALEPYALELKELIVDGNKAVAKGYFSKFKWGEYEFGPMQFVTILTFNENGKIVRHEDWINYPSNLIDYNTRINSNDWIEK